MDIETRSADCEANGLDIHTDGLGSRQPKEIFSPCDMRYRKPDKYWKQPDCSDTTVCSVDMQAHCLGTRIDSPGKMPRHLGSLINSQTNGLITLTEFLDSERECPDN